MPLDRDGRVVRAFLRKKCFDDCLGAVKAFCEGGKIQSEKVWFDEETKREETLEGEEARTLGPPRARRRIQKHTQLKPDEFTI